MGGDGVSLTMLMEDHFNERAREIQLGLVGKIKKFDKEKMRADVQPLMKIKNALGQETDYPVLADVPVLYYFGGGFFVRPVYESGDLVWVGFSTFDTDQSLNGYARAESGKIFSLENAVVISGIAKTNTIDSTAFASNDGLIIGHKDGNAILRIEKDKIIFKFGTEEITLSSTGIETTLGQVKAGGEVSANNATVATKLSTHNHPIVPGLGGSTPSSPPTPGT